MKKHITNDILEALYLLSSGFTLKKTEHIQSSGEIICEFAGTEKNTKKISHYNKHKQKIDVFIVTHVLKTLTAIFDLEREPIREGGK